MWDGVELFFWPKIGVTFIEKKCVLSLVKYEMRPESRDCQSVSVDSKVTQVTTCIAIVFPFRAPKCVYMYGILFL